MFSQVSFKLVSSGPVGARSERLEDVSCDVADEEVPLTQALAMTDVEADKVGEVNEKAISVERHSNGALLSSEEDKPHSPMVEAVAEEEDSSFEGRCMESLGNDSGDASEPGRVAQEVREASDQVEIGLVSSGSSLDRMIVPVEVAGVTTKALVDTGASRSMVDAGWLSSRCIDFTRAPIEGVQGFGVNNRLSAIGKIDLHIKLGGFTLNVVKFTIVQPQRATDVPVILGEEFLTENRVCINLSSHILKQELEGGRISSHAHER